MKLKEQEIEELREYFSNLKLTEWEATGNVMRGGQADILEVRNTRTKELGVFRKLRSDDEKDVKRFIRELKILIKTDHPNVVKLLDYTKDNEHWYISKLGTRFETYWEKYLEKNSYNPEAVLMEGIRVVQQLANGLTDMHDKVVVHRDIKPKNVVVIDGRPTLIDFGIAFVTGEERYTDPNEAMANVFSPDPALNFMEEVPPWLDVFLLSQLLIWMVSKGHNKPHSQRPLDWRWVVYPNFGAGNLQKVKAITGLCSNYSTSPSNARELNMLIDSLFGQGEPINNLADAERIKHSKQAIQEGYSARLTSFSDSRSMIESRLPLFVSICQELEAGINKIVKELGSQFTFTLQEESGGIKQFTDQYEKYSKKESMAIYSATLGYAVGEGACGFGTTIIYCVRTTKGIASDVRFKFLENRPYIAIHLNDSSILHSNGKTQNYHLTVSDNGALKLLNWGMEEIRETTTTEIVQMIRDSITDPEVWRIAAS